MTKRMFSSIIISSDAFLDMPTSAQALYLHLNMAADNEGFVGNPKGVIKSVNAGDDDLKILVIKRFILMFSTGIIVIKHWFINNTLRSDRFIPTTYQTEKKMLTLKDNRAYTENELFWLPDGLPKGNEMKGKEITLVHLPVHQPELDPIRVQPPKKPMIFRMNEDDFETFWKFYPRKQGKGKARISFLKLEKRLLPKMLQVIEIEKASRQWQDPRYIPMPATWLNQERWDDELSTPTIEQEIKALIAASPEHAWMRFAAEHSEEECLKYKHLFDA